jgi:UDP-N-acetyl-D-glucosamine dehydrogenase
MGANPRGLYGDPVRSRVLRMSTLAFVERIKKKEAVVGIVGLGYVGLPLMLSFTRAGFRVVGFDIDGHKVTRLMAGESYIHHISTAEIASRVREGRFRATTDFAEIATCDAALLCVPTPLGRNREPDMTYIEGTGRSIAPHLRPGQLVALESTTYPGTTDELLRGILETGSGLQAGRDFFLAYSPEREDPGNPTHSTQSIPKVVGGLTSACTEMAMSLYGAVLDRVIPVSSTRVAEMTKLLENIFRSVNIALVNELKVLGGAMGIDIWEVIAAASTKPFGYMPFYPGPGLGGHCIPIDPFYLTWKAREYEQSTRFIELAGEINTAMPMYVVERLAWGLNEAQKPIKGSRVLILGVAYKKDVDDMRESPALRIIELLQERGARVSYHDPFVPRLPRTRQYHFDLESVPLDDDTLAAQDAALIVTDHSGVDYARVVATSALVVDTRNATRGLRAHRERIVRA